MLRTVISHGPTEAVRAGLAADGHRPLISRIPRPVLHSTSDDLVGTHVILERRRAPDHVADDRRGGAAAIGRRSDRAGVPGDQAGTKAYVAGLLADAARPRRPVRPAPDRRWSDRRLHPVHVAVVEARAPRSRRGRDRWHLAGRDAKRSPVNSEAKLLLLAHAFDVWSVHRVAICTDDRNERSRGAIERLGATLRGRPSPSPASTATGEAGWLRDTAMYSIIVDDATGPCSRRVCSPNPREGGGPGIQRRVGGMRAAAVCPPTAGHVTTGVAVAIGLGAGLLAGLFGVGGGLIIVPGLLIFGRMDRRLAHGTSLGIHLDHRDRQPAHLSRPRQCRLGDRCLLAAGSSPPR